jgi:hypothetical protein
VVSFTPLPFYPRGKNRCYPLDRRLGVTQSRLDAVEWQKISCSYRESKPDRPAHRLSRYRPISGWNKEFHRLQNVTPQSTSSFKWWWIAPPQILTSSMDHGLSCDINSFSASQEIPWTGTQRFTVIFVRVRRLGASPVNRVHSAPPHPTTILSRVLMTTAGILDWTIAFIGPYTYHSELQEITALPLIYTLYSSTLRTHYGSQSSLVVSWQRIYNGLTVTAAHTESYVHSLTPFLPLFCNCWLSSILLLRNLYQGSWRLETCPDYDLFYNHFERTTQKTQPLYFAEGVVTRLLLAYSLLLECVYRVVV